MIRRPPRFPLFPSPTLSRSVMVCVPPPPSVPAAGDWLKLIAPGPLQPSLTLTPPLTSGTTAWQVPSALTLGTAEQITLGAVLSVTVKLAAHVALPPTPSHSPTITTCTPSSP